MSKPKLTVKDHGMQALFDRVAALRGSSHVKVGVLADSDRGGLHVEGEPLTVAEIALVVEFGTRDGKIPARPAFRDTFERMRDELTGDARKLLLKVLFEGFDLDQAYDALGAKLGGEFHKTITGGEEVKPTNADSVKKRKEAKGKNGKWGVRTWVDTGRVLGAISWAVVRGGVQGAAKYVGR